MNIQLKVKVDKGILNARRIYEQESVGHISVNSIASCETIYLLEKIEELQAKVSDLSLMVNEHELKLDFSKNKKAKSNI